MWGRNLEFLTLSSYRLCPLVIYNWWNIFMKQPASSLFLSVSFSFCSHLLPWWVLIGLVLTVCRSPQTKKRCLNKYIGRCIGSKSERNYLADFGPWLGAKGGHKEGIKIEEKKFQDIPNLHVRRRRFVRPECPDPEARGLSVLVRE